MGTILKLLGADFSRNPIRKITSKDEPIPSSPRLLLLYPESIAITDLGELQLAATIVGEDGLYSKINEGISWSSSLLNADNGYIKPSSGFVGAGFIDALQDNGSLAAQHSINVINHGQATVKNSNCVIKVGKMVNLSISNTSASWRSLTPDIVSIDSSGSATALAPGCATIEAEHSGSKSYACINVVPLYDADEWEEVQNVGTIKGVYVQESTGVATSHDAQEGLVFPVQKGRLYQINVYNDVGLKNIHCRWGINASETLEVGDSCLQYGMNNYINRSNKLADPDYKFVPDIDGFVFITIAVTSYRNYTLSLVVKK